MSARTLCLRAVLLLAMAAALISSAKAAATNEEKAMVQRLEDWAHNGGLPLADSSSTPLFINMDAPLRGIYTKRPMKKDDVMVQVKDGHALAVTVEKVTEESQALQFLDKLPNVADHVDSHVRVALWLLEQKYKGDASPWAPYVASHPSNFSVPAMVCDKAALEPVLHFTEGQRALKVFETYNSVLEESWDFLVAELFPHFQRTFPQDKISFQELRWAWWGVKTRTWNNLQLPWVDMFNHDPFGSLPRRENDSFTLLADRDYEAGEEVFISYGAKSNQALWETYGFVLDDNQFDCVYFDVNLDSVKNKLFQAFLRQHAEKLPKNVCLTRDGYGLGYAMPTLRYAMANGDDLDKLSGTMPVYSYLSIRNELEALRTLLVWLAQLSKSYSTTVEDENNILLQHAENECVRTVLKLRADTRAVTQKLSNVVIRAWNGALTDGLKYPTSQVYDHQFYATHKL